MHSHDHEEHSYREERAGRKGRGGRGWFGAPWGPVPGPGGPGDVPRAFGVGAGPGLGGPFMGGRGWARGTGRGWGRARRGDVRSAILVLLAERPMHGYEIIGELSERTEGLWRPSPGSIYPTLQLLEDEGLIVAGTDDTAGKRHYSLTEEGRSVAAELAKGPSPWEQMAAGAPQEARSLRQAVARLMPAIGQVFTTGASQDQEEAVKVLEDARRKLYTILAGDLAATQAAGAAPATGASGATDSTSTGEAGNSTNG
jgi:DNA-binding PadR family transcriptional regulator